MIGDFEQIKKDFTNILMYSQAYPFDLNVDRTLAQWESAKSRFIEIFNGTRIESRVPIVIEFTKEQREDRFNEFLGEVDRYLDGYSESSNFIDWVSSNSEGFYDNRVVCGRKGYDIKPGAKLLRSFKKFFPKDPTVVRQLQDIASGYIQETKIEGYLCLSVDPRDFLTLSENNSKWTSCHSLDGDYRAGNLSYMVDDTTLIAYLYNGKKENLRCAPNDVFWTNKKWRMLIHTNFDTNIYLDRQYPFTHPTLEKAAKMMVVNTLFPRTNKDFNFWGNHLMTGFRRIIGPEGEHVLQNNCVIIGGRVWDTANFINDKENLGYTDSIRSMTYTPVVAVEKDAMSGFLYAENDKMEQEFHHAFDIKIGSSVICPCCGKGYLNRTNSFLCDTCIYDKDADEDFYCRCSSCDKHIYDNDVFYKTSDGEILCKKCYKEMKLLEEEEQDA